MPLTILLFGQAIAAFAALVCAASAAHKLLRFDRLAAAAAALTRLPGGVARIALGLAAALEIVAAVLAMTPALSALGLGVILALWTVYLLLLALNRGNPAVEDCGCSLSGSAHGPVGAYDLMRSAALVGLAAVGLGLAPSAPLPGRWLAAALGLFLAIAYFSVDELASVQGSRRGSA